jgi:uncharacterized membrane protein YqaE (UPF0057 family)
MKISVPYSILFVAGAVLFSSNSHAQGITITKRHYKAGYYVDFGNKKKIVAAQQGTQNIALADAKPANTIPLMNMQNNEPMALVATQNVVVKREKVVKQIKASQTILPVPVTMAANKSESYNSTSALRDDSKDEVNAIQHDDAGVNLLLVVIITIFIPPLGVALVRGIHIEFWLDLILTLLFFIPGLIYGLIVVLS